MDQSLSSCFHIHTIHPERLHVSILCFLTWKKSAGRPSTTSRGVSCMNNEWWCPTSSELISWCRMPRAWQLSRAALYFSSTVVWICLNAHIIDISTSTTQGFGSFVSLLCVTYCKYHTMCPYSLPISQKPLRNTPWTLSWHVWTQIPQTCECKDQKKVQRQFSWPLWVRPSKRETKQ